MIPEAHQAIYQLICDALFASVPENWRVIRLELDRLEEHTGAFAHSISSPEGFPPVAPVDELYEATFQLDELLRKEGGVLRHAVFVVAWDDEAESWNFRSEFHYIGLNSTG